MLVVHAWCKRLLSAKSQTQAFVTHLSRENQKYVEDQGFLPLQPHSCPFTDASILQDGSPTAIHICLIFTRPKDFCILTFWALLASAHVALGVAFQSRGLSLSPAVD